MVTSPGTDDGSAVLLSTARDVIQPWATRSILARLQGVEHQPGVHLRVSETAESIAADILAALTELLETDVAEQRTSPLALIREHVAPANALLKELGAEPPRRDEFERRSFPDDLYGLGPTTWSDIDPALQEPGLIWGAHKAMTLMRRRPPSGADDDDS